MTDQYITGKWTGRFVYEHGYTDPVKGKQVTFDLEVISNSGHFTGYCTDEEQLRFMNAPATIEGYVQDDMIYFTKRYAHASFMNHDGSMVGYPNKPPHDIHYTGYWNEELFAGKWEIFALQRLPEGGYQQLLSAGSWTMEKVQTFTRLQQLWKKWRRWLGIKRQDKL